MENTEKNTEILENGSTGEETDYIQAIQDLKANSVSKEQYGKLKEENKKLLNALTSGEQIEGQNTAAQNKRSLDEIRSATFKEGQSNLEFWKNTLELRERVLEETGEDVFLPHGHNIQVEDTDIASATRVADVVQQCIDYADGDSQLFTQELQRRTMDTPAIKRR